MLRFSSDQKTDQIVVDILVKNGSPTAETPVWVKEKEASLNSIWMLGDFHWGSCLSMSLAVVLSLDCKVPLWCVLFLRTAWMKEGSKGLFPFWWYAGCVGGKYH